MYQVVVSSCLSTLSQSFKIVYESGLTFGLSSKRVLRNIFGCPIQTLPHCQVILKYNNTTQLF